MSYDLWQTAFAFSMASNGATGSQGNAEALRADIQVALGLIEAELLKAQGAVWEQGWGPFVWQAPGSVVADNAMVVMHNLLADTYIVAVAATNAFSSWDWINEDLAVQPDLQVPWPGVSGAYISRATSIGINQLMSLQNSDNLNLQAYLKTVAGPNKTLIITGHSLAGALTPALALGLFPKGQDGSGWGNVYVMPSAGASPGNGAFASAFAAAFPPVTGSGYQNWNQDVVNTLDVVPHAWMTANLNAIPDLYQGMATSVQSQLTQLVSGMVALSSYSTFPAPDFTPYQSLQWATFAGQQQNPAIATFEDLMAEILYQHVKAYMAEFGIAGLFPTGAAKVSSGLIKALGH
jgi:hypothetical protein